MRRATSLLAVSVGLVLGLAFVATPDSAFADEKKAQLKQLKRENKALHKQLNKLKRDFLQNFTAVTQAEQNAGMKFNRATAVYSKSVVEGSDEWPAKRAVHMRLRLRKAEGTVRPALGSEQKKGQWVTYRANPRAVKKPTR